MKITHLIDIVKIHRKRYNAARRSTFVAQKEMEIMIRLLVWVLLIFPAISFADAVTFYIFPTPSGIKWQSPSSLAQSLYLSLKVNTNIAAVTQFGHAIVEIQCDGLEKILSAMTTSRHQEIESAIPHRGPGVFFDTFSGKFEDREVIEDHLRIGKEKKEVMRFMTFQISPQTCQRLTRYHQEYVARGLSQYYNLTVNPRTGQGAACTNYVVSFLDVAGLMTPEFDKEWIRSLRISQGLIGPVNTAALFAGFGSKYRQWISPEDETKGNFEELRIWDPDLIFAWVKKERERIKKQGSPSPQLTQMGRAEGVHFDSTAIPTPQDDLWISNSPSLNLEVN